MLEKLKEQLLKLKEDKRYFICLFYSQFFPFLFFVINNYRVHHKSLFKYFMMALRTSVAVTLLFIPLYFILRYIFKKKYKIFLVGIILINFFFNSLEFAIYINFATQVTPELIYILFETNKNESVEFIKTYSSWKLLIILFYWIGGFIFFRLNKLKNIITLATVLFIMTFGIIKTVKLDGAFYLKNTHIIKSLGRSISRYRSEIKDLEKFYKSFDEKFKKLKVETDKKEAVYVMVIGESLSKYHSEVYGYPRENQPYLTEEKNKDNLIIFNDVVSPHHFTRETLKKIITTEAHDNNIKFTEAENIIDIMKKAGFKTYWLSNQEDFAYRGAGLSSVSQRADVTKFTESSFSDTNEKLKDGALFPLIEEAFKDNSPKKFIVIHLFGNHAGYDKRYPEDFTKFSLEEIPSYFTELQKSHYKILNHYDNSVYYNDYVMKNIIEKLKADTRESYLLYLSDHGQSLADRLDAFGNLDPKRDVRGVEIPFMIWVSEKYKKNNKKIVENIKKSINNPYVSEDVIYTLIDLSSVKYSGQDEKRSIVNPNFTIKKRIVSSEGDVYEEQREKQEKNYN